MIRMNKTNKHMGISLIVLVITIIVIIILASAVILSLAQNNPIMSASEAKFKMDIEAFNNELLLWLSGEYSETLGALNIATVNATKISGDYKNLKLQEIITTMNDDYADDFVIQRGRLIYIGSDDIISEWAKEVGVTNMLRDVSNYVIYYSDIDQSMEDQIKNLDLAVLEPAYYTEEEIQELKSSGTVVLGYIPISQVNVNDTEFISLLEPDDYIYEDGVIKTIYDGGIYITNLASQHYCDVVLQLAKSRMIDKSFDGIFIDCIDYAESMFTEEEYNIYKVQYENILKQFKLQNNNALIMQNRGFRIATDVSDKYIDAILWENFQPYEGSASGYELAVIDKMTQFQSKGIKVFAVSHADSAITEENLPRVQEYAESLGYIYYHTPYNHYNSWPF